MASVSKKELDSISKFQEEIHYVNSAEDVTSVFHETFLKLLWYSSVLMSLESKNIGDVTIYTVNNTYFHFLQYTYLRFITPPIKVKDEYKDKVRICWCHNLGSNVSEVASFEVDDIKLQEIDNVWQDIHPQFFQKGGAGMRENYNIGVGNVSCMEDWSTFIPSYPINVEHPWFYSQHSAFAFPIHHKSTQTRAVHKYTFKRKLGNLLRMQIKAGDKWKSIKPNTKYINRSTDDELPLPELWGRYAKCSDNLMNYVVKSECAPKTVYIRDIVRCDCSNPNIYGTNSVNKLLCSNPCLSIFWVAENMKASDLNNRSNYTTNVHELYKGWNPIKKVTFKYGSEELIKDMPSDHFSLSQARKHFMSAPAETGYNAYSWAYGDTRFHSDIGVVLDNNMNAELVCEISDGDIFANSLREIEGEEDAFTKKNKKKVKKSPEFVVRVRLLVMKKFSMMNDENGKPIFKIE